MDRMNHRLLWQQLVGLAAILLLLAGCTPSSEATVSPAGEAASTPISTSTPAPSDTTTPTTVRATAPPDYCMGWTCTLKGIVYVNAATPGNELPGVQAKLSQFSNCSPTEGEHETVTGPDGTFQFEIYLHDTDTFWFDVEEEGYEPVRVKIGGFDCLFCHCPPVEIVLKP